MHELAAGSGRRQWCSALPLRLFLFLLLPLLAALLVVAVLAPLALGGWTFSTEALALKPERLNPAKGLARVFSLNGLAELAKALAKFTVLALTAGLLLWRDMGSILSLGGQGLAPAALIPG